MQIILAAHKCMHFKWTLFIDIELMAGCVGVGD